MADLGWCAPGARTLTRIQRAYRGPGAHIRPRRVPTRVLAAALTAALAAPAVYLAHRYGAGAALPPHLAGAAVGALAHLGYGRLRGRR